MLRAVVLVVVIVAVVVGLALLPLPNSRPASAEIPTTASAMNPTEIDFVRGGNVALDLQAGNYDVVPSSDNKITVNYDLSGGATARDVRIASGVKGHNARIRIESPSNGFHAEIALPEKSNVYIRLTAGNLNLDAIEGSKDIDLRAGNATVDVGDTAKYGPVYASVTSGNIQANAWSVQKSGLVRSFSANGKGPYGLRAHVDAGNLILVSKGN